MSVSASGEIVGVQGFETVMLSLSILRFVSLKIGVVFGIVKNFFSCIKNPQQPDLARSPISVAKDPAGIKIGVLHTTLD